MSCSTTRPSTSWANGTNIADKYLNIHLLGCWENVDRGAKVKKFRDSENICTKQTNWPKKKKGFFIFSRKPNKGEKRKGIKPICENHKNKTKKGCLVHTHDPTNDAADSAVVPNVLASYFLGGRQSYRLNRKRLLCFFRAGGTVCRFSSRIRSHSVWVWEAKDEEESGRVCGLAASEVWKSV